MELEKIRGIISEQMCIDENELTLDTSFIDDLGADSLNIFQIISDVEEAFNIEFSNDDAENIKTIGDAVEYVKGMLK